MRSSVVVATDNPDIINVLSSILMKKDCSMLITKSKLHSIFKIISQDTAYFILDYELDDNSNLELFNIIRKIRPRLPIIIISSDNSYKTIAKTAEMGIFYYALKPVQIEELEKVIDAAEEFAFEQRDLNCVYI